MRRASLLIAAVLVLGTPFGTLGAASAASPASGKSQFYDFGKMLIDGQVRVPTLTDVRVEDRPKFERMLKLRKDLVDGIFTASKERTFK